jgi:hypothetical protein
VTDAVPTQYVLERYYGDLCCSDEREYYRVVVLADAADQPSAR